MIIDWWYSGPQLAFHMYDPILRDPSQHPRARYSLGHEMTDVQAPEISRSVDQTHGHRSLRRRTWNRIRDPIQDQRSAYLRRFRTWTDRCYTSHVPLRAEATRKSEKYLAPVDMLSQLDVGRTGLWIAFKSNTASCPGLKCRHLPLCGEPVWVYEARHTCSSGGRQGSGRTHTERTEELDSGFQFDRHRLTMQTVILHESKCRLAWALKEGHCIASSLPRGYKLFRGVRRFLSLFVTHLCKHADSIPSLQPTAKAPIMSSVTPQHSDGNHLQPHLVNLAHHDIIWRLAYLPDGRRTVTGSSDGTVKVWNLENGEQEGTSIEHESQICGLAVTRDGTNIVSVCGDGKIKVWDVKSHEIVKEWTHPESWPEIAISPDNRHIAVGAWTVAIYTMEGKQVNHSIQVGDRVSSLRFSPDGKKLACGTRDGSRVFDVDTGRLLLGLLQGNWIRDVLWSRDGSRLFLILPASDVRGHVSTNYTKGSKRWKGTACGSPGPDNN